MAGQTRDLRMHQALIIGSRVLVGLVGLIAFYFAFFLFEDEEGVWQNRLENLWIAISDTAEITNSTSNALINKIGDVLRRMFIQLFGDHMFSFRAVAVSTNLSLAGATLTTCLFEILALGGGDQPGLSGRPKERSRINFARDLQERLGILALLALPAPFRICKLQILLATRETDPVSGHHILSDLRDLPKNA